MPDSTKVKLPRSRRELAIDFTVEPAFAQKGSDTVLRFKAKVYHREPDLAFAPVIQCPAADLSPLPPTATPRARDHSPAIFDWAVKAHQFNRAASFTVTFHSTKDRPAMALCRVLIIEPDRIKQAKEWLIGQIRAKP